MKANVLYDVTKLSKKSTAQEIEVRSFDEKIKQAELKIKEDLFRFRTCCADPRASK
ncbi:MAG: hypothetical protein SWH61_05155 [Thermodesulfobacteriota bacterium]|nr:hypothetical protein [Thermodesulfobacteriota bacterium]